MENQATGTGMVLQARQHRFAIVSWLGMAWSNTQGWVEDQSYDVFTQEERQTLSLPIGGHWMLLD